ncbi:MAG: hypothetical protein R2823_03855 [Acidimicrobiia bacterium]
MRVLFMLVLAAIVIGLLYLQLTHEGGLPGVWDDVTNRSAPSVEIEYHPVAP